MKEMGRLWTELYQDLLLVVIAIKRGHLPFLNRLSYSFAFFEQIKLKLP